MKGKRVVIVVVALGILGGLCYASYRFGRERNPYFGPTVTNLEKMGHLVSLRVNMGKVVPLDWTWGTGMLSQKLLYVANGDALLVSDIRGVKVLEKDDVKRTAKIRLSCPTVLSPRLDHEKSYVYDNSFWLTDTKHNQMTAAAEEQAQREFAEAAASGDNVSSAKANARELMTKFWELIGWQVEVVFDDEG